MDGHIFHCNEAHNHQISKNKKTYVDRIMIHIQGNSFSFQMSHIHLNEIFMMKFKFFFVCFRINGECNKLRKQQQQQKSYKTEQHLLANVVVVVVFLES